MDIVSGERSNLEWALNYSIIGYRVFPIHGFINGVCSCCKSPCPQGSKPGKHPACPHGSKDATTDANVIEKWFSGKPWLNVGIALDADVLGLDIDPKHGGEASLNAWVAEHGHLPLTPTVRTGSDGRHMYFALPPGITVRNKSGWAPGIDTRSAGGYLVAPPSIHECGGSYEWITPLDSPLAMAPEWLIAIVGEKATTTKATAKGLGFGVVREEGPCDFASHPGAGEGKRHQELCRLTGIHLDRGDSLKSIVAMAVAWGSRCDSPCEPKGVEQKVMGLARKDAIKRGVSLDRIGEEGEGEGSEPGIQDGNETNSVASGSGEFHSHPIPTSRACEREANSESAILNPSPLILSPQEPEPVLGLTKKDSTDDATGMAPEGDKVEDGALGFEPIIIGHAVDTANAQAHDDWPQLHEDAFHGLAGRIIEAIAPETEADPVAVLLTLLTAFGNAVGSRPCFSMLDGDHYTNIFAGIIGGTASGKGRSAKIVRRLMAKADPEWETKSIATSLSSGEGFVDRVKDDDAEVADFFGVPEAKRLLIIEPELARTYEAMGRQGNTLSGNLRSAWDHDVLEVNTRGKSKLRASNAHVSIVVHCTPDELAKLMAGSMNLVNGFSNRFLWACVKRSNILPRGGKINVIDPFATPLSMAIEKARGIGPMEWQEDAGLAWDGLYEGLTAEKPGAYGAATQRAHGQTLRLSMLYALLDGEAVIKREHLRAALAVWRYCEASAKSIFGGESQGQAGTEQGRMEPGEEPLDFKLLMAIEKSPGIKRTDLLQTIPSRKRAMVPSALDSLEGKGLAHKRSVQAEAGGRPGECWYPGPTPEGPDDDDDEDDADKPGVTSGFKFGVVAEGEGDEPLAGRREVGDGMGTKLPSPGFGLVSSSEAGEVEDGNETREPQAESREFHSHPIPHSSTEAEAPIPSPLSLFCPCRRRKPQARRTRRSSSSSSWPRPWSRSRMALPKRKTWKTSSACSASTGSRLTTHATPTSSRPNSESTSSTPKTTPEPKP